MGMWSLEKWEQAQDLLHPHQNSMQDVEYEVREHRINVGMRLWKTRPPPLRCNQCRMRGHENESRNGEFFFANIDLVMHREGTRKERELRIITKGMDSCEMERELNLTKIKRSNYKTMILCRLLRIQRALS